MLMCKYLVSGTFCYLKLCIHVSHMLLTKVRWSFWLWSQVGQCMRTLVTSGQSLTFLHLYDRTPESLPHRGVSEAHCAACSLLLGLLKQQQLQLFPALSNCLLTDQSQCIVVTTLHSLVRSHSSSSRSSVFSYVPN